MQSPQPSPDLGHGLELGLGQGSREKKGDSMVKCFQGQANPYGTEAESELKTLIIKPWGLEGGGGGSGHCPGLNLTPVGPLVTDPVQACLSKSRRRTQEIAQPEECILLSA